MVKCFVRGYIARDAKPNDKYWKNGTRQGVYFDDIETILSLEDAIAQDWNAHDPEGGEMSLVG